MSTKSGAQKRKKAHRVLEKSCSENSEIDTVFPCPNITTNSMSFTETESEENINSTICNGTSQTEVDSQNAEQMLQNSNIQ